MNKDLQDRMTSAYNQYRESLQEIADNPEMETREKMEQAQVHHRVLVDMISQEARDHSARLDERTADLEKVLYHGDKDYLRMTEELATLSDEELRAKAAIASRTGNDRLARAVAVVGRERGNHQLFYDFVQSSDEFSKTYEELMQIPEVADREAFARQFVPPQPQAHDVRPSAQEMQRREHERTMAQSRRIQAQANARAAAGLSLYPPPQQPRKFVGRESKGGGAA